MILKMLLGLVSLAGFVPLTFTGFRPESTIFFLEFPYFFIWLACFAWLSHLLFSVPSLMKKREVSYQN